MESPHSFWNLIIVVFHLELRFESYITSDRIRKLGQARVHLLLNECLLSML